MQKFVKYAAVALFTVSATAAHAGGFGWGSGGHRSTGGLLNLSPSIDLGGLNAPILNDNNTSILSGILNGNAIGNGNGILNNLLGGNRYSVRNSRGGRHHRGHW